ncbi:SDR family oxidoreductase [Rossellomorea sp. NPDC077527]|uniref:SDR family oxidoreductase n=1 Tax=Rossellomorea sp. NPDC077527 TaxID=3364510 RepID=UPI0037CCB5DB
MMLKNNKVAIITGASSGIGQATAKELASKNITVMLAARREDRLKVLKDEIEQMGGTAYYQVTDVTNVEEMEKLAQHTIEKADRIDVLVNNAGLMPLSFINKRKIKEWDQMVDVNIKGVLYGISAVLPYMEKQRSGHIINISSVAGHKVMPGSSVYSGTKYAVRAITEGLRQEMNASHNIRTTIICPGAVATELTETITDEDILKAFKDREMKPLDSDNIAKAISFAVEQPDHVDVNEIIVRPTQQDL